MSEVEIRGYQAGDDQGIADLRSAVYGESTPPQADFRWRHFQHPSATPLMQVAVSSGEIVGIQPVEVFDFAFEHRPLTGAVLSGVMVRKDHRRRGIFSELVEWSEKAAWEHSASFVVTMPNDTSVLGFRRRGYTDLGERHLLACAPRSLARHRLPSPSGLTVQTVDCPGGGYDLFDKVVVATKADLIQRRNQEWVTWRYGQGAAIRYRTSEVRDASGDLLGFAVTRTEKRRGLRLGYLVDVLGVERSAAIAAAEAGLEDVRRQRPVAILAVVSNSELVSILKSVGFTTPTKRLTPKSFFTVCRPHPDGRLSESGFDQLNNWYLTLGDWDTI